MLRCEAIAIDDAFDFSGDGPARFRPARILNPAMELRALVATGFCPEISAMSFIALLGLYYKQNGSVKGRICPVAAKLVMS